MQVMNEIDVMTNDKAHFEFKFLARWVMTADG